MSQLPADPHMPQLLTEQQVEEITGIKKSTLQNWRVAGKGPPYVKFGTSRGSPVRYDAAEITRFIDQHRHDPSAGTRAFVKDARV